jgi:PAS domain S-box-containing protein
MAKEEICLYDRLLNKLDIGVFRQSAGKSPRFSFVNAFFSARLGYQASELLEMPLEALFSSKQAYVSLMKRVELKGDVPDRKVVLKARDGQRITTAMTLSAVKSSRGRIKFIDGFVKEIVPDGLMRNDQDVSSGLFKTVFEHSAAAIMVADKDERIVAWNPFTEKILDMGWKDLFNRPVCELYPPAEWRRLRSLRVRHKGVVSDIETKIYKKGDVLLDINLSLSVIKNSRGEITGSIGIMSDVSSQKKAQKMLLDAKKAAEAASEAKTMFLANMSHEVRTPMNTILGMVDLTLDMDLNAEQKDNLLTVKNAADILLSLLNDILDLSRVEAGKIQLEHIEINIERILRSVCKTMDILARNKGLSLQWVIDENVPDIVKGDPVRIRQILVNLINNAIKFTHQGKIHVDVRAGERSTPEICELQFSVMDEGIGIEKDKQEKIFDVFTQEDVSTTRRFGGAGLGLSICKKLLELMDGKIWVESEKGKGSTFRFVIPCAVVNTEDVPDVLHEESIESQLMAQISRRKAPAGTALRKSDVHILLAEDNLVNQKMTQRILEKKGWRVSVANDGQEVLSLLKESEFDLILMDAQMPVLDGLEATRRIRALELPDAAHIPIIALTARVMTGDRKKCLDAGMDGYVSKPIDCAQLYETIESFFVI